MKSKPIKTLTSHVREKPIMSTHHRIPVAQGGRGGPTIRVTKKQHDAWHHLFDGTLSPHDIASIINAIWLDPDFYFVVRRFK